MKLLFDENLSPRLATALSDLFPGSSHVHLLGLAQADDRAVWEYARRHDYVLVSKDSDYYDLSMLHGHPPKIIWLRLGNCTTNEVEEKLRAQHSALVAFGLDAGQTVFLLS